MEKKNYLINIKTGKIHSGKKPCPAVSKMAEFNKKWFDTFTEAENYYGGEDKKADICSRCFTSRTEAIEFESL